MESHPIVCVDMKHFFLRKECGIDFSNSLIDSARSSENTILEKTKISVLGNYSESSNNCHVISLFLFF